MNEAPSPVLSLRQWDAFNRQTAEHCFLMKSAIFLSNYNQNCCARSKKSNSNAWAAAAHFKSMCGSSRRRTRIYGAWYKNGHSVPIFTIASMFFRSRLPPLREREDDIPILIEHFVQKFAKRQRKSIDCIPDEVMEALKRHDWPGNLRELQNVIERAVIMTTGPVLELHARGPVTQNAGSVPNQTLEDAERAHITKVLRETNWVVGGRGGAATRLGLARTTLIAMMQRLGIRRETLGRGAGPRDQPSITVPNGLSHASHGTPRENVLELISHLNSNSGADLRQARRVSART